MTDNASLLRSPPNWVADAVVYQIFPDRFRRGKVDHSGDTQLKLWGQILLSKAFRVATSMG